VEVTAPTDVPTFIKSDIDFLISLIDYPQSDILFIPTGALPLNPTYFFVLTQKSKQKKSRLCPLHSKN
jgi:hypothetical protein